MRPVFAGGVAEMAVRESEQEGERTVDAAGPDIFPFRDGVRSLERAMNMHTLILRAPLPAVVGMGEAMSLLLRDTPITREELEALVAETLVSHHTQRAPQHLRSGWLITAGAWAESTAQLRRHWRTAACLTVPAVP